MKKRRIKNIERTLTKREEKRRGTLLKVELKHDKKLGEVVSADKRYAIFRSGVFM